MTVIANEPAVIFRENNPKKINNLIQIDTDIKYLFSPRKIMKRKNNQNQSK